jgi:hypothetical protein
MSDDITKFFVLPTVVVGTATLVITKSPVAAVVLLVATPVVIAIIGVCLLIWLFRGGVS